ncbi:MAG TPA: hypothetical protein GX717_01375, partial [Clostridiaceae bacterium]|nr:hypothetical protein [Clostridiaceae bacterium]
MRGLIALSGALSVDIRRDDVPETADIIWLRNYCEKADLVIAADGGLNHLYKLGIQPHFFIGDQDSMDSDAWTWGLETGMKGEVLNPHKDMTDGEAAIQMALKHGCTELILLGSIGASRPD